MAKLTEYLTVGMCQSYGDADYRWSADVVNLSREQMDKLMLMIFHGQRDMWEHWYRVNGPDVTQTISSILPAVPKEEQ